MRQRSKEISHARHSFQQGGFADNIVEQSTRQLRISVGLLAMPGKGHIRGKCDASKGLLLAACLVRKRSTSARKAHSKRSHANNHSERLYRRMLRLFSPITICVRPSPTSEPVRYYAARTRPIGIALASVPLHHNILECYFAVIPMGYLGCFIRGTQCTIHACWPQANGARRLCL